MKEDENKFGYISDSGLRWALERMDRQLEFEKTMIFKFCAVVFAIAVLCALSSILIFGRTPLGFGVGFISILLLGIVLIIWLIYVDLTPLIRKAYIYYRKNRSSKKINRMCDFFYAVDMLY